MRSLVLHIHDDDCFEARFQVALDVARSFDGHIHCVQAIPYDIIAPSDAYAVGTAELMPILKENADRVRERIEARLADEGVAWDWVQEFDAAGHMLVAYAALSDVVVLGTSDPRGGRGASSLAGQVAIHARTPVLAVPPNARGFDPEVPAIVAWNGSVEASHALRAAVPLLKRAASVQLITVEEARKEPQFDLPPTEGAEFLSRHGIECDMVAIPLRDGSVDDTLRHAAQVRRAGYIVMGAYGHTRLRETVLGGATNGLLANPPLPLFLCH
jgi:nucleotide-binding universal stress UspA family protein